MSEIIQDKAGQDDGEPAEPDRGPTEMAHVGIHGLTAGDGQEGGTEHGKTDGWFRVDEVAQRTKRAPARRCVECGGPAIGLPLSDGRAHTASGRRAVGPPGPAGPRPAPAERR